MKYVATILTNAFTASNPFRFVANLSGSHQRNFQRPERCATSSRDESPPGLWMSVISDRKTSKNLWILSGLFWSHKLSQTQSDKRLTLCAVRKVYPMHCSTSWYFLVIWHRNPPISGRFYMILPYFTPHFHHFHLFHMFVTFRFAWGACEQMASEANDSSRVARCIWSNRSSA